MWTLEEAEEFIEERIVLHQAAEKLQILCTDEERWYTGTTYAITKPGMSRALKVLDDRPLPSDVPEGYTVEERPGVYRRCESYCEVRAFCTQHKEAG
jgi:hypothetical protein